VIRGVARIKKVFQRLMSSYVSSALVLLYHRVADLQSDPQLLSVTPKHFAEHLEILGSKAQPLALEQLANTVIQGRIPNRGVVVTFDDGYSDNLRFAKIGRAHV
jgi:peptidoglycan/xylan/chitin deacetylase (PgdA/CDA1 family)